MVSDNGAILILSWQNDKIGAVVKDDGYEVIFKAGVTVEVEI